MVVVKTVGLACITVLAGGTYAPPGGLRVLA